MLTGDSENAAKHIAEELNIDGYLAGVLPEDKANYVKKLRDEGHKVVMVGDGVNDTPALSCADVSISSSLEEIVVFKQLSKLLMKRIKRNYTRIITLNTGLILLGMFGVLPASTTSLIHNGSTFIFAISSSTSLLEN